MPPKVGPFVQTSRRSCRTRVSAFGRGLPVVMSPFIQTGSDSQWRRSPTPGRPRGWTRSCSSSTSSTSCAGSPRQNPEFTRHRRSNLRGAWRRSNNAAPGREDHMNVRIIAMTLVAGLTALGVASAQNVPSQFVVSGKAAEQIQDFTTINLATAERIAETCEKLAVEQNVAISIYVLDQDGNHVYMDRMDGQGYLNVITAEMKARTA